VAVALVVGAAGVGNMEESELQISLKIGRRPVYTEAATAPEGEIGQEGFRQNFVAFQAATSVRVDDAVVADDVQLLEAGVFCSAGNVFAAELVQSETCEREVSVKFAVQSD
jgi:hypothetical protein